MQYPTSEDSIFRSTVKIVQPVSGYRFALDAVLLAHFIRTDETEKILEVGAGSGIVTVLLSLLQRFESAIAVEVQSELANLCKTNFEKNKVSNATVYDVDVKALARYFEPSQFDLIFSNPPYRKMGSGKLNPSTQKAIARHEILMKLSDLFECAETFLKPTGRMTIILPGFRERDFLFLAKQHQFHLKTRQYVHSFRTDPPAFFLTTIAKGFTAFEELPSLVIYQKPGEYSEEMKRLLTEST